MISLRKAKISDYALYSAFLKESSMHWLYLENSDIDKFSGYELIEELGIEKSFIESFYKDYTEENYQKDLSSKTKKILMIENNQEIIGSISVNKFGQQYRIAEWAIQENFLNEVVLKKTMEEIEKIFSKVKEFSVFPSNKKSKKMLELIGFQQDKGGFYIKKRTEI